MWQRSSTKLCQGRFRYADVELINDLTQKNHVGIVPPCFRFYATAKPDTFYSALPLSRG
ncbi:hypothetical protein PX52LOC_06053 [Limnoglobus roseus]|uniref:Uncharacterized protein n=1 Tax=Limnoglobus roseus TaxID=2598579 RepID=A0A5C1ALI1_9BACT|nr:hypothetical protein PX52LOC_06053 [Limnoglobus roseus]